jgi:hypothetical protein
MRPLLARLDGEAIRLLAAAPQMKNKVFLIPVGTTPTIFARHRPPNFSYPSRFGQAGAGFAC